jgi:hypothetical protein
MKDRSSPADPLDRCQAGRVRNQVQLTIHAIASGAAAQSVLHGLAIPI